ncbi:MAG: HD domain-containing protein [Pseudomonadota bacterium]
MRVVSFSQMKDGKGDDYRLLHELETEFATGTADRLIEGLRGLAESLAGYKIDRLDHSLQCATRAWRDGADIDWVVSALLHDIGDVYAPYNHDEYAAAILRPFVREQCTWTVEHHADFQLFYYGHHIGAPQHKRDCFRDNIYFDDCVEFCERWDQSSFDPDYRNLSLDFFAPMVREVFARPPHDPAVKSPGERVPLGVAPMAVQRARAGE